MTKLAKTEAERFWAKVEKIEGENACWVWRGASNERGYGFFTLKTGLTSSHRAVWFLTHGQIPNGLQVLHKCDNPPCVRPDHLYLGTHEQNMRDREERNRTARGARHWMYKDPEKARRAVEQMNAVLASEPERRACGERNVNATMTEEKIRSMRVDYAAASLSGKAPRGTLAMLGRKYGIDRSAVGLIVSGRAWKHVR